MSYYGWIGVFFLGLVFCAHVTSPASAAGVRDQGACGEKCPSFSETGGIPVIRSFFFTMPTKGQALVHFNGTMTCTVNNPNANNDVIDLAGQIVQTVNDVAVHTARGGNRYEMRLHHNGDANGPSATMNLAVSRLLNFETPGFKKVFFKISRLRMDNGTFCAVNQAGFIVVIFP